MTSTSCGYATPVAPKRATGATPSNGNGLLEFRSDGLNDFNFLWLCHPGSPKAGNRGHPIATQSPPGVLRLVVFIGR